MYGPVETHALQGVRAALSLRESLLTYLKEQIALLASEGQPFMRPVAQQTHHVWMPGL